MTWKLRRRRLLAGSTGALLASGLVRSAHAAPAAEAITPALVEAAKKEGKIVWYTSVDLALGEKVAKVFETKYPGISVKVERSGAERNFQRIGQEYASRIYNCDVVNSSDAAHFIIWKAEAAGGLPARGCGARLSGGRTRDADGMYASWRITLSPIAYNTSWSRPRTHRSRSPTCSIPNGRARSSRPIRATAAEVMTATQQLSRDLGWGWFEKLAKQKVMQVQSATEPPKKMVAGERPIMADGGEYLLILMKEKGDPIE
jgi:iron(III) transport system substrate-binding protein